MPNDRKTVALINEGFGDNLGDKAISKCLLAMISLHSLVRLIPFSVHQSEKLQPVIADLTIYMLLRRFSRIIRPKAKARVRWWFLGGRKYYQKSLRKRLQGCDAVIVGGGQLIKSNISLFAERLDVVREECNRIGIPYSMFGAGVDANIDLVCRDGVKRFFTEASHLCVRDHASRKTILSYGVSPSTVSLSPDVAFSQNVMCGVVKNSHERRRFGVNVMSYSVFRKNRPENSLISHLQYLNFWAELVKLSNNECGSAVIFTTGASCDYSDAKYVKDIVMGIGVEVDLAHPKSLDSLNETLSSLSHSVVSRMHAGILGVASDTRCVALGWDEKVIGCWQTIGQAERVFSTSLLLDPSGPELVWNRLISDSAPINIDRISAEIRLGLDTCLTAMLGQ